jgi:hypothetical protein
MSDLTVATSASTFAELFTLVRDGFAFAAADSDNFGPFSASYSVALHLENGSVQLNDDGTVEITALDIVWDTLKVEVCFNFPGFTIPGFCVIPDPWNGCLVGIPDIHIGGPICIPLDLSGLVSEISTVRAHLETRYFVDPARPPGLTDLQAEVAGTPNKWQVFIAPDFVSVDPIDIPASIGNLFENLIEEAIEDLLPDWIPDLVKNVLMALLQPVVEIVKAVLDVFDSVEDFLQDLIGEKFDLLGQIETVIAQYFASQYPIEFEDPYPILEDGPLIPVKIPLRDLKVDVNSKEMIITGDIG